MSSSTEGRSRRRELLETIEEQKETLSKYETRLRDVVRAYKGLAKEKEALEETLKAVVAGQEVEEDEEGAEGNIAGTSNKAENDVTGTIPDDASSTTSTTSDGGDQRHHQRSESRIRKLTASITTLAAEKSRLEASFQEDRKKSMLEKKDRDRQIEALQTDLANVKAKAKADLEEIKSKLIVERHDREKETSDHAHMLREIQRLLSDERRAKDQLETALHEAETKIKQVNQVIPGEETERKVKILEGKLKFKTEEAEKLRKKLSETPPELEQLRIELRESKAAHRRELEWAEKKAEEAEARVAKVRVEQEQRVNSLEARLQELSETVGTYDRLRQHDQAEIDKLKDRVQQLGHESNVVHAQKSPSSPVEIDRVKQRDLVSEDFKSLPMEDLLDIFVRLKSTLEEVIATSDSTVDLRSLLRDCSPDEPVAEDVIQKLQVDLDRANQELESYRRQASSPKSVTNRNLLPEVDQEALFTLRAEVSDLKEQLTFARQQVVQVQADKNKLEEEGRDLQEALISARLSMKDKLDTAESDYRSKILQLEAELQKQRDRCLTLIEEKEDEVDMLKSNMELAFERAFAVSEPGEEQLRRAAAATIANSASGRRSRTRTTSTVDHADDLTEGLKANNDGMVLHYVQELAHKDVEIGTLRRQVFEVESAMRELQTSAVAKEEKYVDEIDSLRSECGRLKRMSSREGANMEYLKNVVLRYMLSSDGASRDHMLKAIGTVLLFSGEEVKQVRDYNQSWFWNSGQTQSAGKRGHR